MTPQEKLRNIREELQQMFLERAELIDGALTALLAAQHILIVGPPGTAKSMLADELCRRITGGTYFQWLLTKFTTPEELFGAVSLKALEADDYRRVTANKLPEAHTKIRHILGKIEEISQKVEDLGRPLEKVATVRHEIQSIQQQLLTKF